MYIKEYVLKIYTPVCVESIKIVHEKSIYCSNEHAYITAENFTLESALQSVEYWRKLAEHRLRGINYWKGRKENV